METPRGTELFERFACILIAVLAGMMGASILWGARTIRQTDVRYMVYLSSCVVLLAGAYIGYIGLKRR